MAYDPTDTIPHVADFLEALRLSGRAASADNAKHTLRRLHHWLHAMGKDGITATRADLQSYQSHLVNDYRSASGKPLGLIAVSTQLHRVRQWYRWLVMQERIISDPSRTLGVATVQSRVVVRKPLSLQEVTALLQTQAAVVSEAAPGTHTHAEAQRNLAAICLGFATGRRVRGVTMLRVDDVDAARGELRVEREKGRVGRVLPMARWAIEVVSEYIKQARSRLARNHDTPWLFLNMEGTGPIAASSLHGMLRGLVQRTIQDNPDLDELPNKTVTWHSLRVSFATLLFSNDCDIRSVNELLLHRRLSTTARYTPIPLDDMRRIFRVAHPRP